MAAIGTLRPSKVAPGAYDRPVTWTPTDRRIVALALPTLGALLAPPLFVLIDTGMVGHLGTPELAGLALASTLLTTVVGLLVFLAYATTAAVARAVGAGDRVGALRVGVDGLWFAGLIGVVSAGLLVVAGDPVVRLFGADDVVVAHAMAYLRAASPGVVGMLITYAATGVLRGFARVRLVMVVAVGGAVLNALLNAAFIYGLGLGVAGSGLGTSAAELVMAGVLAWAVVGEARRAGVSLRASGAGLRGVGRVGLPLFVRTVSLRIALLTTMWVATGLGVVALSAHQIVMSLWNLAAFALDAVAIAAQTLIGEALGGGRERDARTLLRRCVRWGVASGVVLGLGFAVSAPGLPVLFTADAAVRQSAVGATWLMAAFLPLAGLVFVLDGVLIGAGDGRYLAWTGVVNLVCYLPFALAVAVWAPRGASGLVWLWLAYCLAYMASRAATLSLRAKGDGWVVLGGGFSSGRDAARSS